jgi:hypothetical protein
MPDFRDARDKMTAALPAEITTLDQIRALPWMGNAAWDVPISLHVSKVFTVNEALPRELRKEGAALAGYLMTGEDCAFATDEDFDEHVQQCLEDF